MLADLVAWMIRGAARTTLGNVVGHFHVSCADREVIVEARDRRLRHKFVLTNKYSQQFSGLLVRILYHGCAIISMLAVLLTQLWVGWLVADRNGGYWVDFHTETT